VLTRSIHGPLAGFWCAYAYWTCIVLAVGTGHGGRHTGNMHSGFPPSDCCEVLPAGGVNASQSVTSSARSEYWLSAIKGTASLIFMLPRLISCCARASGRTGRGGGRLSQLHRPGGFLPAGRVGRVGSAVIVANYSTSASR